MPARRAIPVRSLDRDDILVQLKHLVAELAGRDDMSRMPPSSERWLAAIALQASWMIDKARTGRLGAEEKDFLVLGLFKLAQEYVRPLRQLDDGVADRIREGIVGMLRYAVGDETPQFSARGWPDRHHLDLGRARCRYLDGADQNNHNRIE